MDQAQLLSIIGALYDKFVADVSARVEANLINMVDQSINVRIKAALDPMGLESGTIRQIVQSEIQAKIDDLTGLDKAMITEIVKGEIEDLDIDQSISDWMDNNFDISDHEGNLDIEDKISDYLSDHLTDRVRDEVRDLSFSVTVD